jgi:NAD(P)-dependent dehydrogenase (short-subunit alcohol dehydrogenase family)
VTDTAAIRQLTGRCWQQLGRIDVIISNAGYGLFGAAEELSDTQITDIIATNLTGAITLIRSALPHLRAQGGGRIIQISSYGGQVAFPGNSLYHATKWGIEGFCESVAAEVAPFGIGVTIVEPGGARTEFRYGSARVADLMPEYDGTPAHAFQRMLDPASGLAPGDPPAWPPASSTTPAPTPPRSASCSAPRPCNPLSTPCARASPASRPRPSSPPPPTSRPASNQSPGQPFESRRTAMAAWTTDELNALAA